MRFVMFDLLRVYPTTCKNKPKTALRLAAIGVGADERRVLGYQVEWAITIAIFDARIRAGIGAH